MTRRDTGMTLVEVILTVAIISAVLVGMVSLYVYLMDTGNSSRIRVQTAADTQRALAIIEKDITFAKAFNETNAMVADSQKLGAGGSPTGGWDFRGDGTARALILTNYATTLNPLNSARQPVFLNTAATPCSSPYRTETLNYSTVYFVESGTLYRRLLVPQGVAVCDAPYQKQTCPVGITGSACPAEDEVILRHVAEFSIDYYQKPDDTMALPVYTNPAAMAGAKAVDIKIGTSRKAYLQTIDHSTSLRIPKVN